MRNRLISALSDKLFVIDAGRNSGTRSTIESGERHGREIEVVRGYRINYEPTITCEKMY
jgi:DNA processing protein